MRKWKVDVQSFVASVPEPPKSKPILVLAFIKARQEGLPGAWQKPAGAYALTVVRDAGRPEVHLAFEAEFDARQWVSHVQAQPAGSYPGWASQWEFQLDGEKVAAIEASLPPLKKRLEQAPIGTDSPIGPLGNRRARKRGPNAEAGEVRRYERAIAPLKRGASHLLIFHGRLPRDPRVRRAT